MATVARHVSLAPHQASGPLGAGEIHVWNARLDLPLERTRQLERSLAADERERSPQRRLSRALLRQVLAGYVRGPPESLGFTGGMDVRPRLADPREGEGLHFSVSHSGDVLLIAVARTPHLGIDVERVRPIARLDTIARRAFTPAEVESLDRAPPDLRVETFFRGWTRKEACVKARGQGVWSAFGRWEVSLSPGEPATVWTANGEPAEPGRWSLFHLEPVRGYIGALAVRGDGWTLRGRTLNAAESVR